MSLPRIVIIPGNGCTPVYSSNWYSQMKDALVQTGKYSEVILQEMPDPYTAKEEIWIPFILNDLGCAIHGHETIIIGHSSGAVATMRLLESYKLLGCVLVSACHTDLGDENERESGYYSRVWNWESIKRNSQFIMQFHSVDDPFIPRKEADFIARKLNSDYTCFEDKSHFFDFEDISFLPLKLTEKIL